jgi:hypothetical protein
MPARSNTAVRPVVPNCFEIRDVITFSSVVLILLIGAFVISETVGMVPPNQRR